MNDWKSRAANYKTVNAMPNPSEKDWCFIVTRDIATTCIALEFDGQRKAAWNGYVANPGDVAIAYPNSEGAGTMGIVREVTSEDEFFGGEYMEDDKIRGIGFVFSPKTSKEAISHCVSALPQTGEGCNPKLIPNEEECIVDIFSEYAKALLAAASVLAHPDMVSEKDLEKARRYVQTRKQIAGETMDNLDGNCCEESRYDVLLGEVHADTKGNHLLELQTAVDAIPDSVKDYFKPLRYPSLARVCRDGCFRFDIPCEYLDEDDMDKTIEYVKAFYNLLSREELNDYINKYAYIAAVSIMVRGGFKNLLAAFLAANPPMDTFYAELKAIVGQCGDSDTLALLT